MGLYKSRKFIPEIISSLDEEKIIDIKCGKIFSMIKMNFILAELMI